MNNNVLISVVITTYSRPNYLERAIRSVLNQTYNPIEIIVVDDNGDESIFRKETAEIIKKFNGIKYVKNKKNLGANKSRNLGIEESEGAYIAFLDDDDEFLPQKISELVKVRKENCTDNDEVLLFSSYNVIGNEILQNSRWSLGINEDLFFPSQDRIYEGNYIGSNSFILIDKKSLENIRGYDECLESSQDWDLYIRLANNNTRFIGVNQDLVNYYSNIEGIRITSNSVKRLNGFIKIYTKHGTEINKLPKRIRFKFFNYLYRRIVVISYFKGLSFLPKLIVNIGSSKNVLIVIIDFLYPILYFSRSVFYRIFKKNIGK